MLTKKAISFALAPSLAIFFLFLLIPFGFIAYMSLFKQQAPGLTASTISIDNYIALFRDPTFGSVFWRTFWVSIVVTVVTLIIAYPVAYFMARTERQLLVSAVYLSVVAPLFVSLVIRSYGWIVLLQDRGVVNFGLHALGLPLQHWLYSTPAVIIGMVHVLLPMMVLPLWTTLQGVDKRYEEAADSLGAGRWSTFYNVTLPMSVPGIAAGSILVFAATMSGYVTPLILGGPTDGYFIAVLVTVAATANAELAIAATLGVLFVAAALPIIWLHRNAEHLIGRYEA